MWHFYLIAAAHERTAGDVQETHVFCNLLPPFELGGFHIPVDFHVPFGRPHVLTKCYDIYVNLPKF